MKRFAYLLFLCIYILLNSCAVFNPKPIAKSSYPPVQILVSACGSNHTLMVQNGKLWAWGKNDHGQLGDGTTKDRNLPVLIDSISIWVQLATSNYHSLGIKADGTLWAWGSNQWGELGGGTKTDYTKPIQIGTDADWKTVCAAESQSLALKTDGSLWVWGSQLNLRNDQTRDILIAPKLLSAEKKWKSLSSGPEQTFALAEDGTIWAFGDNHRGWIGTGTSNNYPTPVQIGTDSDWVQLSAGFHFCLALKTDGSLWSWGSNNACQIGNPDRKDFMQPTRIGTDWDWKTIAAGGAQSYGLKKDGSLWSWGNNYAGQLGRGHTTGEGGSFDNCKSIKVGPDTTWINIAAGNYHAIGLKADGSLCSWGLNDHGQLGDANNINRSTPLEFKTSARPLKE